MRKLLSLNAIGAIVVLMSCGATKVPPNASLTSSEIGSIWAVDLVRTLPGAQEEYLGNIKANWANARRLARASGTVRSYRALVAPPDADRGWDVLLMTEYADSAAFLNRESIFASIFASPGYVRVEPARPTAELRAFTASNVAMRLLIAQPSR